MKNILSKVEVTPSFATTQISLKRNGYNNTFLRKFWFYKLGSGSDLRQLNESENLTEQICNFTSFRTPTSEYLRQAVMQIGGKKNLKFSFNFEIA